MNILYLTWNYPPRKGGMENYNWQLSNALKQQHQVEVVTRHAPLPEKKQKGIYRAPVPGILPYFLYAYWRGKKFFRKTPVDGIIGGSASVAYLVSMLSKKRKVPVIVLTFGLDLSYPGTIYQKLLKRALPRINYFVAISKFTQQLLVSAGISEENISIIPPGVDTTFFTPVDDAQKEQLKYRYGLQGRKIILCVGRLVRRKGIVEFVRDVFPSILKECRDSVLVIIGDEPTEAVTHKERLKSTLMKLVAILGLQNKVIIRGWVNQECLRDHYRMCDFCILPAVPAQGTDNEGFGMVIIEAAACEKPTVATNLWGIPEAIEHDKTGLLVAPGSQKQLADAIVELLNKHSKSVNLGRAARQRTLTEYDLNIVTNQFCTLVNSVIF